MAAPSNQLSLEAQRAADAFEKAERELEEFWRENPGLYEHLSELLRAHREAANLLEAAARRHGDSVGAARLSHTMHRINPEALRIWVAEHGEGSIENLGGSKKETFTLPVEKLRQAVVKGLISQAEADSLTVPSPVFSFPEAGSLPKRKE